MLKTSNFTLIIFLNVFSLFHIVNSENNNNIVVINNKSLENSNFSGEWNYEFNSYKNELRNRTFKLNLVQKKIL